VVDGGVVLDAVDEWCDAMRDRVPLVARGVGGRCGLGSVWGVPWGFHGRMVRVVVGEMVVVGGRGWVGGRGRPERLVVVVWAGSSSGLLCFRRAGRVSMIRVMAGGSPRRTTTIRRSLLGNLVVLVGLTGGAIVVASWVAGDRAVERMARLLIEPTAQRIEAELDRFFGDVRSEVLVGRSWAARGALDPTDHEALNTLFVPVLEQNPRLSSMMVADSAGREYLLLRDPLDPDVWMNRVVRAEEMGTRVFNRRWNSATGSSEEWFGELDYDPRRRIWFREALQTTAEDPVFWTEPVIFFVTKDPGITASTHLEVPADSGEVGLGGGSGSVSAGGAVRTVVVAFDLLLLDISRFTSRLRVSENGKAFVLVEGEGGGGLRVVGLPRDERSADDASLRDALMFEPPASAVVDSGARLPRVDEVGSPVLERAVRSWSGAGRPREAFAFDWDGRAWLGEIRAHPLSRNTFWIGVVLPERDLLGGVRAQRAALLAVVVLILLIGLVRAAALARRFSGPVEALVRETERMSGGDLGPGGSVSSNIREFRRLAPAQEGMREGLRARMKLDKIERDLDIARDIQRGLMPRGRPDTPGFTVEGWSLPADQTGGDYFDWMATPGGGFLVTLADVTGHGIGPALIVAVCRAYLRAAALGVDVALPEALSRVNTLLHADIPPGRFVTAAVGVLDTDACELALISAGQAPLFFYRASTGEVERWDADEVPLGVAADLDFGAPRRVVFEPGDALILLTDGFFEWPNGSGKLFGIPRLEAFVRENAALAPGDFIRSLHGAVLDHAAGEAQPDDLTCVVVKRDAL